MGLLDKAGGASNTTEVKPKAKAKAVAKAKPVAKAVPKAEPATPVAQEPVAKAAKPKKERKARAPRPAVYQKDSKFQINWIVP